MELRFWSLQRKSYLCHLYLATLNLEDRSRRGAADTSPRHRPLLLSGAMYHNSQFLVVCDRQSWSLLPPVWGWHTDVSSRRDAGAHWIHVWVHWRWRWHGCAPTNPPKTKTLRFTTSQPHHGGSQPRCIHVNHVMAVHNLAVFMSTTLCRFPTSLYSCQPRHAGSQPRCIHVNHVMPVHNLAVFMSNTSWRFTTSLYSCQPRHGGSQPRCTNSSLMARMPASTSAHQAVKLQIDSFSLNWFPMQCWLEGLSWSSALSVGGSSVSHQLTYVVWPLWRDTTVLADYASSMTTPIQSSLVVCLVLSYVD